MAFYQASLQALAGDREAWGEGMRAVLRGDARNPYYLWFIGKAP